MGKGRKPIPKKVHILHGSKRRLRDRKEEPDVEFDIPDRPHNLSYLAKKEWDRIIIELAKIELTSEFDKVALEAYVRIYARWRKLENMIKNYKDPGIKGLGEDPYLKLCRAANQAAALMKNYLVEFGMTPSSRSRIRVQDKGQKENEYEKWKRRNKK